MNKTAYATIAAGLLLSAAPAAAQGTSWTGCHVGLHGGYAVAANEISVPGFGGLDGISSEGAAFIPAVGCDLQVNDRIVIGAFADYAFRSVDTTVTLGGFSESVGLEDAWSIGGRAGLLLSPSTLAYGLLAYQRSDFDDAGTGLISDLSGVAVGGGIETMFHPGWSLRGEYRYVSYSDKDILGVANLDTDEHSFRAGIVWRPFN